MSCRPALPATASVARGPLVGTGGTPPLGPMGLMAVECRRPSDAGSGRSTEASAKWGRTPWNGASENHTASWNWSKAAAGVSVGGLRTRMDLRAARSVSGLPQRRLTHHRRSPCRRHLGPARSVLVRPPLVLPAVYHDVPPPSPGAGIVPLVAKRPTQLSDGLMIVTPGTISSPAAVPALQRLISTPDAQLATLLPAVPVTRFDLRRLFAIISLYIAIGPPLRGRMAPTRRHRTTPSPLSRPRLSRRVARACGHRRRASPSPLPCPLPLRKVVSHFRPSSSPNPAALITDAPSGGARSLLSSVTVTAAPAPAVPRARCYEHPRRCRRPGPVCNSATFARGTAAQNRCRYREHKRVHVIVFIVSVCSLLEPARLTKARPARAVNQYLPALNIEITLEFVLLRQCFLSFFYWIF